MRKYRGNGDTVLTSQRSGQIKRWRVQDRGSMDRQREQPEKEGKERKGTDGALLLQSATIYHTACMLFIELTDRETRKKEREEKREGGILYLSSITLALCSPCIHTRHSPLRNARSSQPTRVCAAPCT